MDKCMWVVTCACMEEREREGGQIVRLACMIAPVDN